MRARCGCAPPPSHQRLQNAPVVCSDHRAIISRVVRVSFSIPIAVKGTCTFSVDPSYDSLIRKSSRKGAINDVDTHRNSSLTP